MDFLTLFISLRCTQACAHCIYGCSPKTGNHMSWDVFTRSLSIAQEHKIPILNFFGGEPLLNPQILPMIEKTLENNLSVILATNCRPFTNDGFLTKFLDITEPYKKRIVVFTARDRFHLEFFDPGEIVDHLESQEYEVRVADYSNYTIALSEFNRKKVDLLGLDTRFSCCAGVWTDYLGVLPDGGWTICPPSVLPFGSIFSHSLEKITEFKRALPLNCKLGCTECLKDFDEFRRQFDVTRADRSTIGGEK